MANCSLWPPGRQSRNLPASTIIKRVPRIQKQPKEAHNCNARSSCYLVGEMTDLAKSLVATSEQAEGLALPPLGSA